jgi:hypothetical protein
MVLRCKSTANQCFDTTLPTDRDDGGFPMNAAGERDTGGVLRGASVYQKPLSEVPKDWFPLPREEAVSRLQKNRRDLPWDQLKVLYGKIDAIRNRKREE